MPFVEKLDNVCRGRGTGSEVLIRSVSGIEGSFSTHDDELEVAELEVEAGFRA